MQASEPDLPVRVMRKPNLPSVADTYQTRKLFAEIASLCLIPMQPCTQHFKSLPGLVIGACDYFEACNVPTVNLEP
jgi:hypothetical protein